MNNKEVSINKVDELVNRAQLAINDWQCSGETYYLRQAQANLGSALELAQSARTAAKAEAYSVDDDDMTLPLRHTGGGTEICTRRFDGRRNRDCHPMEKVELAP